MSTVGIRSPDFTEFSQIHGIANLRAHSQELIKKALGAQRRELWKPSKISWCVREERRKTSLTEVWTLTKSRGAVKAAELT